MHMNKNSLFGACLFTLTALLTTNARAQTKLEIKQAKHLYEGDWVNKKSRRHLRIIFEPEGYATVNDWVGKFEAASVDAYKAFVKSGKLILPEDKEEHIAPYCELLVKNNVLQYRCKRILLNSNAFTEGESFVKAR